MIPLPRKILSFFFKISCQSSYLFEVNDTGSKGLKNFFILGSLLKLLALLILEILLFPN